MRDAGSYQARHRSRDHRLELGEREGGEAMWKSLTIIGTFFFAIQMVAWRYGPFDNGHVCFEPAKAAIAVLLVIFSIIMDKKEKP